MPGAVLDATILPKNELSRALFKGAGYVALSGNLFRNVPEHVPDLKREPNQRGLSS